MSEIMEQTLHTPEHEAAGAPQIPSEPAPPIQSRVRYVDVAARRAKQLRRGARPRLGEDLAQLPHKAERVAMEEVRRGLVYYDMAQLKRADDGSLLGVGTESDL